MSERKFQDDDIELWGNTKPLCPYCGTKQDPTDILQEADVFNDEPEEIWCQKCDKPFYMQFNTTVRFNTFVDIDNA